MHAWVTEVATTVDPLSTISARHHYSDSHFVVEATVLRGMLAIETGTMWRLSLMRLWYGIDPCWCGATGMVA